MKKVTSSKHHQCNVCSKTFTQKSYLVIHRRIHTGEKPYKCDVCSKTFRVSKHLKRHSTIHTGERNFLCDICKKTFSRSDKLKRHMDNVHGGKKCFDCGQCGKSFVSKNVYTAHSKSCYVDTLFKEEIWITSFVEAISCKEIFISWGCCKL